MGRAYSPYSCFSEMLSWGAAHIVIHISHQAVYDRDPNQWSAEGVIHNSLGQRPKKKTNQD